jgi:hypothetical protein
MNNWKITWSDGTVNIAVGDRDYWTGMGSPERHVISVEDLGPVTEPIIKSILLSKTAFIDHAETQLGGMDRLMEVLEEIRDHPDRSIRGVYEYYQAAVTFEKDKATVFFDALNTPPDNIITQDERDDLVENWPQ